MSTPLVDFSFIYEMAEGDTQYAYEVIGLFLTTVKGGLEALDDMINNSDDYEEIKKKAHYLKSSSNVVKVRGMKDTLMEMEDLASTGKGKDQLAQMLKSMQETFTEAIPVIEAEIKKNEPVVS